MIWPFKTKKQVSSENVLDRVILYFIRDPKRQSGVMIRQPAEYYQERRELRAFIAIQIYLISKLIRRPHNGNANAGKR